VTILNNVLGSYNSKVISEMVPGQNAVSFINEIIRTTSQIITAAMDDKASTKVSVGQSFVEMMSLISFNILLHHVLWMQKKVRM
jgi:hypothetical protein